MYPGILDPDTTYNLIIFIFFTKRINCWKKTQGEEKSLIRTYRDNPKINLKVFPQKNTGESKQTVWKPRITQKSAFLRECNVYDIPLKENLDYITSTNHQRVMESPPSYPGSWLKKPQQGEARTVNSQGPHIFVSSARITKCFQNLRL